MCAKRTEVRYAMIKGISSLPMTYSIMAVRRKTGSPKPFGNSPRGRV